MVRIELFSGEQLVHALNPGEDSWMVPEINAGLMAHFWSNLRRAVLEGVRHFLGGWVHLAFWLALCLAGDSGRSLRLVGAFTLGQILAIGLGSAFGLSISPALAEGAIAVAAVVLLSEALKPVAERRHLLLLSAAAGLVVSKNSAARFSSANAD